VTDYNSQIESHDEISALQEPQPADRSALEGILPTEAPKHDPAESPSKAFKPWHLPRKQHVRQAQWSNAFAKLLDDLPDRQLIKYLCLPGEDMLDVESFAELCKSKERRLKYLGFDQSMNSEHRSNQRITAEQIVHQTSVIDEGSQVLPDNFTSIARTTSIGNRHLRDGGSYDVVNLDLCDAFTTHVGEPTHAAILELLTHQTHSRGEPWLLFITTRSNFDLLQKNETEAYTKTISDNAKRSTVFVQHLATVADEQFQDIDKLLESIQKRIHHDTCLCGKWLTIGIGKWLLGISGQVPSWRVDLLSAYAYRSGLLTDAGATYAGEPPNLFSLVFRFSKIKQARQDPTGLDHQHHSDSAAEQAVEYLPFDEVKLAEKLARTVAVHTKDLDLEMANDPTTYNRLCEECESMLSVRYYSKSDYREWISKLPQVVAPIN